MVTLSLIASVYPSCQGVLDCKELTIAHAGSADRPLFSTRCAIARAMRRIRVDNAFPRPNISRTEPPYRRCCMRPCVPLHRCSVPSPQTLRPRTTTSIAATTALRPRTTSIAATTVTCNYSMAHLPWLLSGRHSQFSSFSRFIRFPRNSPFRSLFLLYLRTGSDLPRHEHVLFLFPPRTDAHACLHCLRTPSKRSSNDRNNRLR